MNFGLSQIVGPEAVSGAYQDTRDMFGGIRKAGQIFKANPIGAVVTDLIFPEPMADGTIDAARRKGLLP